MLNAITGTPAAASALEQLLHHFRFGTLGDVIHAQTEPAPTIQLATAAESG